MKLKLIRNDEVVISKSKHDYLIGLNDRYGKLLDGIHSGTATFVVYKSSSSAEHIVEMNCGNVFFPIKRFDSDDPDYNRVCAEELCELLNQEQ